MNTIGVISDTHGFWDPNINKIFAGVSLILHAGDVGPMRILDRLEKIAPVKAVLGNVDAFLNLADTEIVSFSGVRIVIQHIVNPESVEVGLARKIEDLRAQVVVFGHTHRPYSQRRGDTLFFNPGSAGAARFGLPRSVGLL